MKSIADVVSASGLAGYAEVALVLFFVAFVAVVHPRARAASGAALEHARAHCRSTTIHARPARSSRRPRAAA